MRSFLLRVICWIVGIGTLAAEIVVPAGGKELVRDPSLNAFADEAHASASRLDSGGWRVVTNKPDEARAYRAQVLLGGSFEALSPGETVLALVRVRSTGGKGMIEAKLQLGEAPFTPAATTTTLEPGPDLVELPVIFRVTEAIPAGKATLTFLCAAKAQTIEIASVRAFHYPAGTDTSNFPRIRKTYPGREPGAPWRAAALERIEKHRKSDFELRVIGSDGKPLANSELKLNLRRHRFGFGSAVTAELLAADSEDARRYREIVDRLFSQVVFENDLKDFGWEQGAAGKEEHLKRLEGAFAWLAERKISVRGHYLMQVAVPPNLAEVKDAEAIRRHFIDTTKERLDFVKDRICEWDVINHPVAWSGADLLSARPGLEKLDREIFALGRERTALPFLVNEDQLFRPGRQADETYAYLDALKREGLRIDGLGNQAHFDESFLPSPEELLKVTDRFAALVPRQVVTEFDIVTQADEELAADYTRDALIACFSHEAYSGFLLWGFWEGRHWKEEAASWNRDWSIRKRGEVLEEWIGRRWHTSATLKTDRDGVIRWRGFPGEYEVLAGEAEKWISVSSETPKAEVNLP
jgi:endo-1,4-beta-xylanase